MTDTPDEKKYNVLVYPNCGKTKEELLALGYKQLYPSEDTFWVKEEIRS